MLDAPFLSLINLAHGCRKVQRIMVMTDVHADREENLRWLKGLACRADSFANDTLILCGDVADTLPVLEEALQVSWLPTILGAHYASALKRYPRHHEPSNR